MAAEMKNPFKPQSCKKKCIAAFHVLGLFMGKKHDLSDKKDPSVTRRCRCS
jgi:hypothetical protein